MHASKHRSIPSVNIHYLQDPTLSTSGYKEVRKITPTCKNPAVKALECFPYAVDTGVHLPEPPSSEDPLFQRLGVLGRQPSVISSFRDALSSRELPARVLTPPMWLIPNNWLLEEYKGPDISAQLGNTLRGYSTSREPVELAACLLPGLPHSLAPPSIYSLPFSTGEDIKGIP